MRISVFGLGYVGSVSAACLAADGHEVIGVDVNPLKLDALRRGQSPVIEPGLDELVVSAVDAGRLRVTDNARTAVLESDATLVCVGTPGMRNGSLDASAILNVCGEIATAMAAKSEYHVVVVRSSVLPGTIRELVLPLMETTASKKSGPDFGIAANPEFLREASAIDDFYHPSFTLIGALDERCGDLVEKMYGSVDAPIRRTTIETAEMVKYASNAFHATKVTFANEIGGIAKAHGIDGRDVMDILCQDRQLNISAAYLRPGFAFGGSCLPKDTRALAYRAKERDLDSPLLHAVMASNESHTRRGIEMIEATGCKRIAILGLSFKPGTDDVRESPAVPLIETLVGRGYDVRVYDEYVHPDKLVGANRAFLDEEIPHITALMEPTLEEALAGSEVVVVTNGSEEFKRIPSLVGTDQILIDLVGIAGAAETTRGTYEGIGW
jgi:GDP-mannose 6-dehydrogenase